MHRFKGKFLVVGAVAALAAAFVLLMGSLGGSGPSTVQATDPTPTPKNANDGNLSGVYDVLVHDGTKAIGLYHAIIKISHQANNGDIEAWVVAYADVEVGDAGAEPPSLPGEGANAAPGPNPPPPYVTLQPQRGSGAFATGTLGLTACFANQGGGSAPNIMATLSIPDIKAQLAGGPPKNNPGVATGTVTVYNNMSDARCAALSVAGAVGAPLPANIYKVAEKNKTAAPGCTKSPFFFDVNLFAPPAPSPRSARCLDFDGDGCNDASELTNVKGCGDDPYNPYDSSIANLTGSYSVLATVAGGPDCPVGAPNQCPWQAVAANNPGPGITFHCIAVVKDPGGALPRAVSQDLYCYIDSPTSAVNPQDSPGCVGDGFPGASPPGKIRADFQAPPAPQNYTCGGKVVWGDVSTIKHTQLTGTLTAKKLSVTGCFEDDDGQSSLGHVNVSSTQDPYGGQGTVSIYAYLQPSTPQKLLDCQNGNLVGGVLLPLATLEAARQSNDLNRDSDGDGCKDAEELRKDSNEALGGLRDPYNRWDFYDVDGDDNIGLFGDIFPVAFDFGTAGSDATDRAAPIAGASVWNLPGPDGLVSLFDDIFGVAFQFGHDCNA